MGFNILRTTSISTPISSSKSKPIFSTLLRSSPSTISPPKSVTPTTLFVSATPFFTLHPKLGFRGGIVAMAAPGSLRKSEEEWRAILSPEQFRILRQKGTEFPGTGEYDKFYEEGVYNCAGCGTPLYRSITKFNSGCGWPAFYEGIPGAINRNIKGDNDIVNTEYAHENGSAMTTCFYCVRTNLCKGTCTEGGSCTSGSGIQGGDLVLFSILKLEILRVGKGEGEAKPKKGVVKEEESGQMEKPKSIPFVTLFVNPFRLIGVGYLDYQFGLLQPYVVDFLLISGPFRSVASPFIDDNAPVTQKTAWLAIFYMHIPSGYALGYVYGCLVGSHLGWRYAFWVESLLMVPFAISGLFMKPLQLRGLVPADSKKALTPETVASGVQGYIAYNFVIGAYSYWGPKAGYNTYHMLLSMTTFIGAAFCFGAFLFRSMYGFLALFSIGELLVFATQMYLPRLLLEFSSTSVVSITYQREVETEKITGIFLHSVDRFDEDSEHQVSNVERSNTMPLLQEKTGETSASPAQSQ
ncbi:Putative sphingolipid transporter spinster like 2 [Glycine soja]|nr:Putative sphingolipid transporter spinster like 2 [Glycine soja]